MITRRSLVQATFAGAAALALPAVALAKPEIHHSAPLGLAVKSIWNEFRLRRCGVTVYCKDGRAYFNVRIGGEHRVSVFVEDTRGNGQSIHYRMFTVANVSDKGRFDVPPERVRDVCEGFVTRTGGCSVLIPLMVSGMLASFDRWFSV